MRPQPAPPSLSSLLGSRLVRPLPIIAGIVGLLGIMFGDQRLTTGGGALLLVIAMALEFGGWARACRGHAKTLGTAAGAGAFAGIACVIASQLGEVAPNWASWVQIAMK